jgi:hypothetical protein
MIRRHALAFRMTLMLADAGMAIALAAWLSVLRFGSDEALSRLDSALPDVRTVALVFGGAWVVALSMAG